MPLAIGIVTWRFWRSGVRLRFQSATTTNPLSLCHADLVRSLLRRRRWGDFQYFLDRMAASNNGFSIQVISVDIVIDRHWSNIADPQVRRFWIGAIRSRFVVEFLGGPPCEAWSQAHGRALAQGVRGPRAVRDGSTPWAKPSLSLRELRQTGDLG